LHFSKSAAIGVTGRDANVAAPSRSASCWRRASFFLHQLLVGPMLNATTTT
jgi:hypothetical protein